MCSKPELLKGSLFHVGADLWEDSTQIPGEKEFQLASPLQCGQAGSLGWQRWDISLWGGRDGRSVLGVAAMGDRWSCSDLYLAPKGAADRWECLEF